MAEVRSRMDRASRKRTSLVLALTLVALGAGLVLARDPGERLARSGLGALLVLVGMVALARRLRPSGAIPSFLHLDAGGVHSHGPLACDRFDPSWGAIAGVRLEIFEGYPMVVIDVPDERPGTEDRDPPGGETAALRARILGSRYSISPRRFGVHPAEMRNEIERRRPA